MKSIVLKTLGCNEKFTPRHSCQTPQAFYIEAFIQENIIESHDMCDQEVDEELEFQEEKRPLISQLDIAGRIRPRTMRVKETVGKQVLIILIDSGSTYFPKLFTWQ
jgi:hypothetical protein